VGSIECEEWRRSGFDGESELAGVLRSGGGVLGRRSGESERACGIECRGSPEAGARAKGGARVLQWSLHGSVAVAAAWAALEAAGLRGEAAEAPARREVGPGARRGAA
jgi:hypothetical protein